MHEHSLEELREAIKADKGKVIIMPPSEHGSDFALTFDLDRLPTPQALDIISRLLPEWVGKFLEANERYKDVGNELGPAGVFPDINRKVGVVKRVVWDGEPAGREPVREVALDLIGHLFLMLHMLDAPADVEEAEHHDKQLRDAEIQRICLTVEPPGIIKSNLCQSRYALPDNAGDVGCFHGPNHGTKAHMGRDKLNRIVEWFDDRRLWIDHKQVSGEWT